MVVVVAAAAVVVVVFGKSREVIICELSSSLSSTAMAGVAAEGPSRRECRAYLATRVIGTRIVVVDATIIIVSRCFTSRNCSQGFIVDLPHVDSAARVGNPTQRGRSDPTTASAAVLQQTKANAH